METTDVQKIDRFANPEAARRVLWLAILFSLAFTAIIYGAGTWLDDVRATLLPDQGVAWYYWKLPEPTFWTRASAWVLYAAHQVAAWGLIYYAQKYVRKYSPGLHRINIVALGVNALFVLLHFVQTHLWYDGLAQDVSIFSSQGSVILLLVLVLFMENQRRGLFFGKKMPFKKEAVRFVRQYHGYLFSWAVIYTFWYHPMETTLGHLWGFFYTFLLLIQGSLFLTRLHVNRWWMLVQEVTVLFHGTIVAIGQGNGIWPMFFFGFAGIFVITQMHGLGLSLRTRGAILAAYIGAIILVYSDRGWAQVNEVIRIPAIDYVLVFVIAGILALAFRVYERFTQSRRLQGATGD
jgi:uncharacterized integral membrane protein